MRQRMSSSAALVVLVLAGLMSLALACREAAAPDVPWAAMQFAPPARFTLWWRLAQACSGTTGDLGSVTWYVVPNTNTLSYQGKQVYAYWMGDPDRIVVADVRRNDGAIIRHEMLHALLHRNGHPRAPFLTSCGGVVACDADCLADAGGYVPPPAPAPALQPRDVGTRFEAMSLADVRDTSPVAVMVTITNPRTEPVWVKLAPRESGDFVHFTFGIIVDYDDPERITTLDSDEQGSDRFPLAAGESRRWVWDRTLDRGRYGIRGYFNVDTTARQVISIGQ